MKRPLAKVTCPVPFCRRGCAVLPNDAEVVRVSGTVPCDACGKPLRDHESFAYPTGMRHVFRDCNGVYCHT